MISRMDLLDLAKKIEENLKKEFELVHLSGNLMDTIEIIPSENGFYVDIPAEIYDIQNWYNNGLIVYTGDGSYAEEVDVQGGFSGKHKEYIERAILESIREWLVENELRARMVEL